MWFTFWLNNLHLAIELFGGVVFFVTAWLIFDTFLIKKELKTALRSLGFLLLTFYFIAHGIGIENQFVLATLLILNIIGAGLVLVSFLLDVPPKIPTLPAMVLVLPEISKIQPYTSFISMAIFWATSGLLFKRYKTQFDKTLRFFIVSFLLLGLSLLLDILVRTPYTIGWIIQHLFETGAFVFLGIWCWQYLKLRIKEELLLIFVTMALSIAIIVTFTFSAILLKKIEYDASLHLASDVKVLDYTIERMKGESLANANLLAKNQILAQNLQGGNFGQVEDIALNFITETKMTFLTITKEDGEVILRTHNVVTKGDNIKTEKAGGLALKGTTSATVEATDTEKFSIRGAAPIYFENKLVGVVLTGYIVDNNLVDKIKKVTGLEATVFSNDIRIATTYLSNDGKTRSIGTKLEDPTVLQTVLKSGQSFVGRTTILSRPYLAAYLPIKNEADISGMISVARPQSDILAAASSTNQLTLLISAIIMVIAILPAYKLAKGIAEQI